MIKSHSGELKSTSFVIVIGLVIYTWILICWKHIRVAARIILHHVTIMTIYNNPHVSRVYLAHVTCRVVAGIIIVITRPLTVTAFRVRAAFVPANSLKYVSRKLQSHIYLLRLWLLYTKVILEICAPMNCYTHANLAVEGEEAKMEHLRGLGGPSENTF